MYRILLVDDEPEALQYFGRMFRENLNKKYEIDVYEVNSAEKAMEYFRECKVDLVVSDIQMPGMNGVEMYQEIKKNWPKSRFLFLTGFMDFDYVYSTAAQDSNTRFLTKLEPAEKILGALEEMIGELEASYQEKELMQQTMSRSREAFPLLQNRCLSRYLYGSGKEERLREEFEKYQIHFKTDEPLCIIGASIDGGDIWRKDAEYLEFALKTVMSGEFQKDYRMYCCLSEDVDSLFTCLLQKKAEEVRRVQDILEYVQGIFCRNTGYTVSFACGWTSGDYLENPGLNKRIRNALGYRNREITENIIPCDVRETAKSLVWESSSLQKTWNRMAHMDELEGFLEMGQQEQFFELFDQMTDQMDEARSMNDTLAQEIYYRLAVLLLRYINQWRLNEKMAFHLEMYKLMRPDLHESWGDGVAFLRKTAETIFLMYFETERTNLSGYVNFVRNYIRENMAEDLSLAALADQIHLNASYLSRLFKKETGEKLYDYVLRVRMQRAMELITEETMKIQEIAQAVGYESVQSFNRAFKKYTGEAPMSYRKDKK